MTRLWGVMAMRLANADLLPLDYRPYAERIDEFLKELEGRAGASLEKARAANARFAAAASGIAARGAAALEDADRPALHALNRSLMQAERALLDMRGIPGRPWYRHQIYAPKYTYAPEVLPGVAEAITAGDTARMREQEQRLVGALHRAAAALNGEPEPATRD